MRVPVDVASVVVFAATDDVAGSMSGAGGGRVTLLGKPMRGVERVFTPFILSADVHYQGSGRCALILRAAINASSAFTTTWPVVPCSLKPTANCISAAHCRSYPLARRSSISFATPS